MRFRFPLDFASTSLLPSAHGASASGASSSAAMSSLSRRFSFAGTAFKSSVPLALALGTTLCGGALLAGPVFAAPTVGSDENGPKVEILAPTYQDVIKGTFRIAVAITAKNYNPEFIEMLVDDKSATDGPVPLSAFGTLSPAAFDWDTRKFADGPHKLTVRVTDKQGFRGWAEVQIFINNNRTVDVAPPDLNWRNIENFTAISGKAQIQLEAKDNFGVKMLMVTINPVNAPDQKPALGTWLFNKPPYIVNFDSARVADGLYTLKANAWDALDQQGEASQMTLGVVNNPINARSIGESLQGLRVFEDAIAAPKSNRPLAPLPGGVNPKAQTLLDNQRKAPTAPAPTSDTKIVASTPRAEQIAPASVSKSAPRNGALSNQSSNAQLSSTLPRVTKLVPSAPALTSRELQSAPKAATPKTVAKAPVAVAAAKTPVAKAPESTEPQPTKWVLRETPSVGGQLGEAPQNLEIAQPLLSSSRQNFELSASVSELSAEAVTPQTARDLQPRLARLDARERQIPSQRTLTEEPVELEIAPATTLETSISGEPSLSKIIETERLARATSAEIAPEIEGAFTAHLTAPALPTFGEREVIAEQPQIAQPKAESPQLALRPQTAISETAAPRLSVSTPATLATQSVPVRAEIEATRSARLSSPQAAPRVAPKAMAPKAATPQIVAPETVEAPQVASAPVSQAPAKAPIESAPVASGIRGNLSKVVRRVVPQGAKISVSNVSEAPKTAPKLAVSEPRVAALPRTETRPTSVRAQSITVAPIQLASRQMPEVHRVERTTTLRAVAARYGLPVELVAACNTWPVEMNVVKGMTVKLPRPLQVSYNGAPLTDDSHSMLAGNSAVTAFRFLFEKAGGKMQWDAKTQSVLATKGETKIKLSIGSKTAKINDREVMMELAAFLFEGRTMVPVRLFEEGLSAEIEWDPQTGRMVVAMLGNGAA